MSQYLILPLSQQRNELGRKTADRFAPRDAER